MDLHELTKTYGTEVVAEALGMSPRCLVDVRRGKSPLTVDDLFVLERTWPAFDLVGTIRRIGAIRQSRGWSRLARREKQ